MKVWELTCEGDKFDSFEPVKMWSVEKRQSFDGRSHKSNWKKEKVKRMEPWKGLELGDYPGFEIPAFSGQAKNLLSPLIDDYVEFLPLQSEEGEFFGVNITKVINGAIDYNKSKIERFNDGRVMTIDEYEFVEEKISGIPIFKIEELKIGSQQFVTEKFVELVKDNHLDGFCFDLVWDSEEKKKRKQISIKRNMRIE